MSLKPIIDHIPTPPGYPEQKIAERTFLKLGPIVASFFGLVLMLIVSMSLTRAFELALSQGKPQVHSNHVDPEISLPASVGPFVSNQVEIREKYLKEQHQVLTSYQWNDAEKTSARIPVSEAMKQVVAKYKAQ